MNPGKKVAAIVRKSVEQELRFELEELFEHENVDVIVVSDEEFDSMIEQASPDSTLFNHG